MIRHAPSIGIGIGLSLRSTAFGSAPPFSPEALNYFSRLDAAGDTTYVDYKQPLANYIDSLVTLGGAYWDDMKSSASFVGVGIQGITVPLRDGMTVPTNNNFVDADLNQLTGLKGDASTKYITTGTDYLDYAQNDASISTYVSTPSGGWYAGTGDATGTIYIRDIGTSLRSSAHAGAFNTGTAIVDGLVGVSRSAVTTVNIRSNQVDTANTATSQSPTAGDLLIYGRNGVANSASRLATYHAGPALNLATLEGLQDTLITEIAAI